MTLHLQREPTLATGTTLGVLFMDGHFFGFTAEDQIREVEGQPVASWKIPGKTAIPAGRYRIYITPSARFHRRLPLLMDVPGFEGIRIHPGNTEADTEGCILVGLGRDDTRGILRSAVACQALHDHLEVALAQGEAVWINIVNPKGAR